MTLDVQFAAPSAFVVEFGTDADLAADLGQTTILSTAPMTLDVQFAAPSAFVVEFGTDADLAADLGQTTILSTAPKYKGETTVTPRTYEETRLETKDKIMPDDVTVRKIPRYEVSNDCGGVTLIMGDEYFNG